MRFGLGPLTIEPIGGFKKHADVYEEALEQATTAEWWGFDSVWADEHHFTADSFNSSSTVVGAALAYRTEYLRVGVMPVLGLVNAIYVAEEVACIDNISAGRTIVAAQVPNEEVARGWGGDGSLERVLDDIEVMRKSWGPSPFQHKSQFHTVPMENPVHLQAAGLDKISVQPKPAQLEMPLWICGGQVAAEAARQTGLPYLAPSHLTVDEVRAGYEGRAQSHQNIVPLARDVFIGRTHELAHQLAAPYIEDLYRKLARAGIVEPSTSFDSIVRDRIVIGDADECIEQLYRYQNELGVNYVVARLAYHGMHHGETAKAIQLFGQAVVPEFRMFGLPDEIRKVV